MLGSFAAVGVVDGRGGDEGLCGDADMGANLALVDLGAGRSAVAATASQGHTCALLVR